MQLHCPFQFPGHDDFCRQRMDRHYAGLLEHENIDRVGLDPIQVGQPDLGGIVAGTRNKTALGEAPLQRHLTAFEADLMKATGTRVLALVAQTRGLARAAADSATVRLKERLELKGTSMDQLLAEAAVRVADHFGDTFREVPWMQAEIEQARQVTRGDATP